MLRDFFLSILKLNLRIPNDFLGVMSTTTLSKLIHQDLGKILQGIRYLSPIGSGGFIPKLLEKYGESEYSFGGHFCCGESSFMLKDKHQIPNKVYQSNHSQYIQGDYVSDHCFNVVENRIFDLSYRQFLIDPDEIEETPFYQNIFLNRSPLFIGEREEVRLDLIRINNDYGKGLFNPERVIDFWLLDKEITERYTLEYFKENHQTLVNYDKILELIE